MPDGVCAMSDHGYGPYTHGCRCDVCREAKAAYMRAKRAEHRREANGPLIDESGRYVAPISTHGTISGYADYKCRCLECTAAKSRASSRQYRNRGAA